MPEGKAPAGVRHRRARRGVERRRLAIAERIRLAGYAVVPGGFSSAEIGGSRRAARSGDGASGRGVRRRRPASPRLATRSPPDVRWSTTRRSSRWPRMPRARALPRAARRLRDPDAAERRDQSVGSAAYPGCVSPRSAVSALRVEPSAGHQRAVLHRSVHGGDRRDDDDSGVASDGAVPVR